MDQNKIANFITELRKEKGLTQMQLAEILGVSNKSVSKWENARCMPDLSLFEPICNEFGITLIELLSGRRLDNENKIKESDNHLFNIMKYFKKYITRLLKFIILCIFCFILLFIIYILVEKYNSKKIYLNYENLDISLCRTEGYIFDSILVDIIDDSGYQVAKEISIDNNIININSYRERRYLKHPESDTQGLQLVNIEKNKEYKIYINSVDFNDDVEKCIYN